MNYNVSSPCSLCLCRLSGTRPDANCLYNCRTYSMRCGNPASTYDSITRHLIVPRRVVSDIHSLVHAIAAVGGTRREVGIVLIECAFLETHTVLSNGNGCLINRISYSVFQLGIFLRALRPARNVLRLARLYSALSEFKNAVFAFSDRGVKMLVSMFSSIVHKIVPRPRFVHVLDCDQILVIRALNCARLCVVCTLNCAQILVVRALDCAQFLLHPALFPTWLEHCYCNLQCDKQAHVARIKKCIKLYIISLHTICNRNLHI